MISWIYTGEAWDEYLPRMQKSRQWGSHLELHAAAQMLGVAIMVTTDSEDQEDFQIWIQPAESTTNEVVLLGLRGESHYYSLEGNITIIWNSVIKSLLSM